MQKGRRVFSFSIFIPFDFDRPLFNMSVALGYSYKSTSVPSVKSHNIRVGIHIHRELDKRYFFLKINSCDK